MKNLVFLMFFVMLSACIFADDESFQAPIVTKNYEIDISSQDAATAKDATAKDAAAKDAAAKDNETDINFDNYSTNTQTNVVSDNYSTNEDDSHHTKPYTKKKTKGNAISFAYKASYFIYKDHAWRNIFHDGSYMSILGLDIRLYKKLYTWIDAGYLHDTGQVISTCYQKVHLTLIPISFGLKFIQPIKKIINFYMKLGPNWFYCKDTTSYPYVSPKKAINDWGATAGIGFLAYIFYHITLDFFVDYIYCKKQYIDTNSEFPIKVSLGGFALGGGLGLGLNF